jgi:hypothetical protein
MSDETEEQFELYKNRSASRAFKINELNKKINAQKDLILRLKEKLKHEFDAGYKLGIKEGIAALDKIKEEL